MNKTSAAIVRTLLLGTSCLSVFGLGLDAARAQPTGGNVVLGTATIADHGGNATTINQTTGKAVINWNSFSIAAGGTVQFNQPGASAITLNRVIGSESSAIYGNLLANGQVWLINGNGVLFGKGSRINVGGLIATTADIRDSDFASGNYAFSGGTGAAVVNQGTIKAAKGGSVVLSGASVSNQGLIQAETGTVVLGGASAFTVDFVGDGLLKYAIAAPAGQADNGQTGVSNSGTISAQGGHVIMTARAAANVADAVVNNTGMISATSAKVQNGEVVLDGGDGDVNVSGTIDASGTGSGETGGSVAVTGRNVTVADNTKIDVSGDAGGGSVNIGGDAHGAGPLANAANTHVGTATITADAIHSGNGGKLVVWSNGITDFSGIFSAKGGAGGGDGGFVETSGHTLNIGPQAKIDTTAPKGQTGTWLLDPKEIVIAAGEGTSLSGGLLALGTDPGQTDRVDPTTITNALATTNVTLQASDDIRVQNAVIYSSTHDLNLMAQNEILVAAPIQNTLASGGGAIRLVAGWDGTTAASDILATPGSYGFDNGDTISGDVLISNTGGNVAVGSASGDTIVAASALGVDATNSGYAQLGFHGAGGGDIIVRTAGDLNIQASSSYYAMIGNGSLGNDVSGDITGNIDIRIGGAVSLLQSGEGSDLPTPWIGNAANADFTETGNVVLVAGNNNGQSDVDFETNLVADLQGGDFFFGSTDSVNPAEVTSLGYSSAHTLSLASTGEMDIEGNIQNSGTGAINVIGGWDGTTVDPAHLGDPGVYGNGKDWAGAVLIDGCGCDGSASIGSWGGKVTVAGSLVDLEAEIGYAQIGYTGAGGGDIAVLSTGDIVLDGNTADFGSYAQIGNGAPLGSIGGPVTGNIFVSAAGSVVLASNAGLGCDCDVPPPPAPVLIGNASGDDDVPPPYSGNVAIFASDIDDSGMLDGFGFGDSLTHDIVGGDFTVGFTDPNNGIRIHDDFVYNSPHTLNLLSAGNITFDASVQNSGSGAITLVAGWNGDTDPGDVSAGGFYGNHDGTISVGGPNANGPLAVGTASGPLAVYGANLVVDGTNGTAQLGFHGAGGGNLFINMTGDITVKAGVDAGDGDYSAQIGNGSLLNDVTGDVAGDIAMTAGGFTSFLTSGGGKAWLGNVAGDGFKATGNVTALTQSGFFGADFIDADLGTSADTGGNVFLGFTDPSVSPLFAGGLSYNSPHDFTFAGAGSLNVTGNIMNAGTGAVTLVAGWDGQTVGSAAQIAAANAFGHNNGGIAVGNTFQFENISVGSAGGLTTLLTHDLTIAPKAGYYAQVGYHGTGSGAIVIDALGSISLAGNSAAEYAQIGNGATFGSNAGSGNVSLMAQTITAGANSAVTAAALTATTTGSIGASGATLNIAANTLTVTTNGGDVFLASPSNGVTLTGVSTSGGAFTLGAGGAIAQSAAIHVGALNVSTTTGAITLLNGGNSFGALTVATQGSDAASLASGGPIVVAGAQVGGTLTLNANGAISQSGALTAGGLVLSANGTIVLNNGGNSFATLAVATAHDASLTDATAVTLGASTVGGTLTLASGGAIGQTGAVTAGGLVLSAGGAILLNNAGNSFATLALTTGGANNAAVTDSTGVTLGTSTVGGTLTLASAGAISQSGALTAGGLVVSANGAIVLNNGGNSFATLAVTTNGLNDASLTDATAVTLGASTVGGKLTLNAGGAVAQSGVLTTHGLNISTASGGIALTNTGNAVAGLVQFNAPGAVSFYNTLATNVGASSAGGDLTLLSKGNVNFLGSVQSNTGNVTAVAGWDGTTTNAAQFGNAGVFGNNGAALTVGGTGATGNVAVGSKSGTTSIYASQVNIGGAHGYAQLGYHGSGGGAILVRALHDMNLTGGAGYAMLGNGSLTADVTGNETGDIDVRIGGNANFTNAGATTWFGNVAHAGTESGNGILLLNDENDTNESNALGNFIAADLQGGDFTLGFTGSQDQGPDHNIGYTSAHTFDLLIAGNAVMAGSIQNTGTGAINLVAGWDGHTLSGFGAAGVSGNGGHGIIIGGSDASGGVAFGSAGGQTSVYGASLALNAVNGYAQLGFNGHGSGAILVNVTGGVTLTGGAAAGDFAQIGNGGLKTSGNNSGDITIVAGGDLALNGGTGGEAYAQVGEGGAESNTGSSGYNNTAAITVTAANVLLNAGGGSAAYTMIGNGGYKSGLNLAGAGVNGGNITVTSGHNVSLHGNGADAFAQIGNGGSQSNLNPSAAATGTDSGDIVVHAPNGAAGAVILAAGTGANSYAQIGNGGYAANAGATVAANFTIGGNVSVTDLSLSGGNGGANSFADIGNGDASLHSVGNISGDIFIDANGQITYVNGTALHSPGTIGNFTGLGLILGLLTGASPPSEISTNPAALGVIASNTANNKSNTNGITTISTIVITPPEGAPQSATNVGGEAEVLGPIALLDNGKDSTSPNTSDSATVVIADSLDGAKKAVGSQTILAGMLKQSSPTGAGQTMHGVPPADQDFSSWGNEALWQ